MTEPTAIDTATDVAPADARGPLPQGTQVHRPDHDSTALPVAFEVRDLSVYYSDFRAVREVEARGWSARAGHGRLPWSRGPSEGPVTPPT